MSKAFPSSAVYVRNVYVKKQPLQKLKVKVLNNIIFKIM